MKQIPNLFTLLNLFFGCLAIIFILQNGIAITYSADGSQLVDVPERIWLASLCMAIAALVDFLDGFVARALKASSAMGKELDSLADVVSFGVAPGMVFYQFLRISFMREDGGLDMSMIWLWPALLIPCAAAYRLARFNLDQSKELSFRGIPTPAVGLLVASFPLIYWTSENSLFADLLTNKWVLYVLIVLLSYGMVSRLPMLALKFKDFSRQANWPKMLLLLVTIIAVFLFHWLAAPIVFLFYIVLSLVIKNKVS